MKIENKENKENKIENKIETQKAHSRAIWHLVMPCCAILIRSGYAGTPPAGVLLGLSSPLAHGV